MKKLDKIIWIHFTMFITNFTVSVQNRPRQMKQCLQTCAKCTDSDLYHTCAKSHLVSMISVKWFCQQIAKTLIRLCRLICAFAVHICPKTHFTWDGPYILYIYTCKSYNRCVCYSCIILLLCHSCIVTNRPVQVWIGRVNFRYLRASPFFWQFCPICIGSNSFGYEQLKVALK